MFIAIDESFQGSYTTLGCIVLPISILPSLEKSHAIKKIEHKLWGEIKWDKLTNQYLVKYIDVLKNFFKENNITFHSWTYKNPTNAEINLYYNGNSEKVIYRHAYLLIRSVIRKCHNFGITGTFYILADESGSLGRSEYTITQQYILDDKHITPKPNIDFCNTGTSQSCCAIQICDLCTGAIGYLYNRSNSKSEMRDKIIEELTNINNGVAITYSHPRLPRLNQFKFHHCLFAI